MTDRVIRKINICLTIVLTIGFILMAYFIFKSSYLRLLETCQDFVNSVKYYFEILFNDTSSVSPSVIDYSEIIEQVEIMPETYNAFSDKFFAYAYMILNKQNFVEWLFSLATKLNEGSKIIILALPLVVLMILLIKMMYDKPNNDHNKDTVPLKAYKAITKRTVLPLYHFVRQYISFCWEEGKIKWTWIFIWALNLNFVSIFVAFLSFYLYFAVSFDVTMIYRQVVKFIADLQIAAEHIPVITYFILAAIVFDKWRRKRAVEKLEKMEKANRGFINDLPIVSMTCGSMGKKKTTVITDMALSQEVLFRNIAYGKLQKTDVKFPNFPWISFEMELRRCMEHGTIFNLATIKEWVKLKRQRYEKHGDANLQLYGYDTERYGMFYYDGLKQEYLFDTLETYAKLYFIYVIQSSLMVTNYSIREDNQIVDSGNFPMWQTGFFSQNERPSRYSHILDFDVLRLGKKLIENNQNSGSFEFGVVVITEVGKERGNNLELKEVKKGTNETNQKNDLFNFWLKMCRHSATVDNYPFIKVFTDEQRPESWGADARDLCDIVTVISSDTQKLALPFFTIEDMITDWCFNSFVRLYYQFRFNRGDNTLLVHILKKFTALLYHRTQRIYNAYGYTVARVEKERGTMDSKVAKKRYYLMNKKIYSTRFSTDCFSDYFVDVAKKSNIGIQDYPEYQSVKASVRELKKQNSYFINALYKDIDQE